MTSDLRSTEMSRTESRPIASMKIDIKARGVLPGIVEINLPPNVILWEWGPGTSDISAYGELEFKDPDGSITGNERRFVKKTTDLKSKTYYLEAIEMSHKRAVDLIELEYEPLPDSNGVVGINTAAKIKAARIGKLFDDARFTAVNLRILFDGDRNGEFEEHSISDTFLLHWFNDDTEMETAYLNENGLRYDSVSHDKGDRHDLTTEKGQETECDPHDSDDMRIHLKRDFEDFAQLKLITDPLLVKEYNNEIAESHLLDPTTAIVENEHMQRTDIFPNFHAFEWIPTEQLSEHLSKDHVENAEDQEDIPLIYYEPHRLFEHRVTPLNERDNGANSGQPIEMMGKTTVLRVAETKRFVFEARKSRHQQLDTPIQHKSFITYGTETEYHLVDESHTRIKPIDHFFDSFQVLRKMIRFNGSIHFQLHSWMQQKKKLKFMT